MRVNGFSKRFDPCEYRTNLATCQRKARSIEASKLLEKVGIMWFTVPEGPVDEAID
jgi:hypothetical protein